MGKRGERIVTVVVASVVVAALVAALVGGGYLLWEYHPPFSGLLVKAALTGKVVKVAAATVLIVTAIVIGLWQRLHPPTPGDAAGPAEDGGAPTYGPPVQSAPPVQPAPPAAPGLPVQPGPPVEGRARGGPSTGVPGPPPNQARDR